MALEFKPTRKVHDPFRIDLGLDLAKSRHVTTIHVLQRSIEKRVIHIHCCIRQVLPIRKRDITDSLCTVVQYISHGVVERGVKPRNVEEGRENSLRAVGRVCRWAPMREEATVEVVKFSDHGCSAFKSRNSLPPEL